MTSPFGTPDPGSNGNSKSQYPKWLRIYLIVLVSLTWASLLIASAIVKRALVDTKTHAIMMIVVASLFSVEFGGIRLISKDRPSDPKDP